MTTPYEPPKARVADRESGKMRPTWLAVAAGLAADVLGTELFSLAASFILGVSMAIQGASEEEIVQTFSATPFRVFFFISGLAFTLIGGYVAARVANNREYLHGLYLGLASMITSAVLIVLVNSESPLSFDIAYMVLAIPAALIGAHLRKRHKRSGV
ncbi:MAG TPA: hypothetical protein VJU83_03150 [Burkholderiales bacterium]|nr:hypothetical protein [Burkholderiales bacterium]